MTGCKRRRSQQWTGWLVVATLLMKPSRGFVSLPQQRHVRPSSAYRTTSSHVHLGSNGNNEESKDANGFDVNPERRNGIAVTPDDPYSSNDPWISSMKKCAVQQSSSKRKQKRNPAFPKEVYPLVKDEKALQHRFISFIDRSITSSYSQTVRLVEPRRYAKADQFLRGNAKVRPKIDDVSEPKSLYGPLALVLAWNGLPARCIVGGVSYSVFPYCVAFLEQVTTASMDPDDLATLVSTFLPGVAIVLGTYFSLTITILYDRFARMQQIVNEEASVLAAVCHKLLYCYRDDDPETAIDAAQCIADQVRTMVFDSRGKETMGIIYNDPYARLLQILHANNNKNNEQLSDLRTNVDKLFALRSKRMTFEALALAPTHFDVMTFLCGLLLIGFALGTVATAQTDGVPTELSKILFALLVVCYTLFYEMSFDLNRPFDGIYQIRRSGAAMHLLQIKHLLTNDSVVAGMIDFDEVKDKKLFTVDCDDACEKQKAKTWYN